MKLILGLILATTLFGQQFIRVDEVGKVPKFIPLSPNLFINAQGQLDIKASANSAAPTTEGFLYVIKNPEDPSKFITINLKCDDCFIYTTSNPTSPTKVDYRLSLGSIAPTAFEVTGKTDLIINFPYPINPDRISVFKNGLLISQDTEYTLILSPPPNSSEVKRLDQFTIYTYLGVAASGITLKQAPLVDDKITVRFN